MTRGAYEHYPSLSVFEDHRLDSTRTENNGINYIIDYKKLLNNLILQNQVNYSHPLQKH